MLRAKQCASNMKKKGGCCTVYFKILIAVEDWWNLETGELYLNVFYCGDFRVRWIILIKYPR